VAEKSAQQSFSTVPKIPFKTQAIVEGFWPTRGNRH
jgi:hypothetical protein